MSFAKFLVRSLHAGTITAVDGHSDRSFARHSHDDFGIGLLTRGAQRSWSGRGPVEAVRGDIITVNPGEVHDGAPIGQERSWSMLYISEELVRDLVADLSEGRSANRELHQPVVSDPAIGRLFAQSRRAAMQAEPSLDLDEMLLALFGRLLAIRAPSPKPTDRRISQLRDSIDDDPAASPSLSAMAAQAGLTRFQTLRAFSRLTGLPPHAYAIQRRLDLARKLIGQDMPLAEAAAEAGFADQSHMHRAFVARHGYTPGQFARAHRA